MDKTKQLKLIDKTYKKMERSIKELAKLKKDLLHDENQLPAPTCLDEIIEAVEKRKYGYGYRLKRILKDNNIITIEEFMDLTALDLLKMKDVGGVTLKYVLDALSRMGINYRATLNVNE